MTKNPYELLGVKADATAAQIRSAYLKLAKKHHPDLNPGNAAAEERFKAIGAAHDLLSDMEKRAAFDRGEIDGAGQPRAERQFYKGFADGAQGTRYQGPPPGVDPAEFNEIFANLFRGHHPQGEAARMRGQDQRYHLEIGFIEAALGASKRLTLPDGRSLDVTIPVGLEDGQTLRLRGQGGAGWNGAPAGDALIDIAVLPHPFFRREGDDIHLDLPVTVAEAVLGAKVAVPTPAGPVTMSVPRHSDTGRQLRLRGRGIPAHAGREAGDIYVSLKVVIGTPDSALEAALQDFAERQKADPRRAMMEAV